MIKFFFLLILSGVFFSCGRIENGSSQDKATYNARPTGGSPAHEAVITILTAKCAQCHASWIPYSDADFVSSGLAIANNPTGSKIYFRNQLGPGPSNNMPYGGNAAMTPDELQTVSNWINTITP